MQALMPCVATSTSKRQDSTRATMKPTKGTTANNQQLDHSRHMYIWTSLPSCPVFEGQDAKTGGPDPCYHAKIQKDNIYI